jgi:hypothetical protein
LAIPVIFRAFSRAASCAVARGACCFGAVVM